MIGLPDLHTCSPRYPRFRPEHRCELGAEPAGDLGHGSRRCEFLRRSARYAAFGEDASVTAVAYSVAETWLARPDAVEWADTDRLKRSWDPKWDPKNSGCLAGTQWM